MSQPQNAALEAAPGPQALSLTTRFRKQTVLAQSCLDNDRPLACATVLEALCVEIRSFATAEKLTLLDALMGGRA